MAEQDGKPTAQDAAADPQHSAPESRGSGANGGSVHGMADDMAAAAESVLESIAAGQAGVDAPVDPLADLARQLTEAQARAAEYQELYLRTRAEMDNIRKRSQIEVANASKFAIEGFAEALVPVRDSLEMALSAQGGPPEALREGVELTLRQLSSAFEKGRLLEVNPLGEKFDPNRHQAIAMVPAPEGIAANHVVTVLQKGYLIGDRILRPALVTVAQG